MQKKARENKMDKKQFEKYSFLCRQIDKLSLPVMDTVQGSSPEPPYGLHTIRVSGSQDSEKLRCYKEEKKEIDTWIASFPEEDQELLKAVAKYGTHWDIIRREIGSWKSPDAVRKRYERIFKR